MTRRIQAVAITLATVVAMAAVWQGCGGSDNGSNSATITGNVSSVSPAQAKLESRSRLLAATDWMFASRAIAQSSCPAKRILACVSSGPGQPIECDKVDTDSCRFAVSFGVVNEFAAGGVSFVNDANNNGQPEPGSGEAFALLTNPLGSVCPGSVIVLNDLTIDFTTGTATAASVEKAPDTCSATATPTGTRSVTGTPPTATPTRAATFQPTLTATAAANMTATAAANMTATANATLTGTPYAYGASLNEPPSTMLAFLFGAGVFGLILPHRRRRGRKG